MTGRDVYEKLMREIAAGKFATDGKLPSEAKLGDLFGASRMTVRGALAEPQRQGLIETRNGAGSYLTRRALRKSGIIGLVIPNFEAFEFFTDIKDELERQCKRLNYKVRLVFTRERNHEAAVRDIRRKVRALAAALRGKSRVDAIVCGNDESAAAVLKTLGKLGKRVPDDVAVVGFDNIALARTTLPPAAHHDLPARPGNRRDRLQVAAGAHPLSAQRSSRDIPHGAARPASLDLKRKVRGDQHAPSSTNYRMVTSPPR